MCFCSLKILVVNFGQMQPSVDGSVVIRRLCPCFGSQLLTCNCGEQSKCFYFTLFLVEIDMLKVFTDDDDDQKFITEKHQCVL